MDIKPDRHRRPPSETKRLSLERDRVNVYGENDKASRKAIPRFKAASNRLERRGEEAALRAAVIRDARDEETLVETDTAIAEARFRGRHPAKRKSPDLPLGLALNGRAGRKNGYTEDAAPIAGVRDSVAAETGRYAGNRRKAARGVEQG